MSAQRVDQAIVRIDPRSVFSLSVGFFVRMLLIGTGIGVLVWLAALVTGTAGSIDTFIQDLSGYPSLTVLGAQGLLVAIVLGVTFVFGGALLAVLGVVLFNLASDLGGGIKMTVMETELDEALMGRDGTSTVPGNQPSGPRPLGQSGRSPGGARRRPVLGANVTGIDASGDAEPTTTSQKVLRGALVVGVERNSPAGSVGLAAGDVIVSVDGTAVDSPAALRSALAGRDNGAAFDMSWVDQRGRYQTAIVHLGDRTR